MLAEKYDRAVVGRRIKTLRLAQGRTVHELATDAKVSAGYISEVERGLPAVSIDKLSQIADALKIKLDTLLGELPDEDIAREVVRIPAALSELADRLGLSHRDTLTLLKGQLSLTARRSDNDHGEWDTEKWARFYEKVKDYLTDR